MSEVVVDASAVLALLNQEIRNLYLVNFRGKLGNIRDPHPET